MQSSDTYQCSDGCEEPGKAEPTSTSEMTMSDIESKKDGQEKHSAHDSSTVAFEHNKANPLLWSRKRKWIVTATVSCTMLLNVVATMACTPAVPQILHDFSAQNPSYSVLIVSIWELGECFGPFIIGPLADHFGRLPIWHICNFLYITCAIISGFSTNVSMLLAFRFLNGFVAAPLILGPVIVSDMFPPEQRATALSIVSLVPMTGLSFGPIIGGEIVKHNVNWRWIFWVIAIAVGVCEFLSMVIFSETHSATIIRRLEKSHQRSDSPRLSFIFLLRALKILVLYPIALATASYYSILWGFEYLIFTTLTQVLQSQYSLSIETIGFCFMGWGFGFLLGLPVAGIGSDWYVKRKRASRGTIEPRDRIPPAAIGGSFTVFGLLLYGWTAQKKVHWMAPITATAIQTFGVAIAGIASKAYLVDSFPDHAASAIAAGSILMSLSGGLIPLAGPPLYARLQLGWGNTVLALIALTLTPLLVAFVNLREQSRLRQIYRSLCRR